jgi:uncharacterized metal-binding protein YceD (DUF177 family)
LKVDKVAVMPEPEFSRTVDVSRIPAEGIRKSFNADADERENLAARFGVDKLHGLEVEVDIQAWKRGSCRVRGSARMTMTRTCVVSLEPFEATVSVRLDRLFSSAPAVRVEGKEITVSLEDDDMGEIVDGEIEVGEFAVEELLLELDPHPRKPGAAFAPDAANDRPDSDSEARESPFAILKTLKNKD